MTCMRRIIYLAILLVFIGVSTSTVFGVDVKFVKEIPLVSDKKPEGELQKVVDFCTTEDGIFLIPDYIAGNVKLYEQNGEDLVFLKNVGSKGYDPGQLAKPAFCSFNKTENKFIILDMGTRRIYFYDRFGRDEFVREKMDNGNEVYAKCPKGAYNIQLIGDKLLVAGHIVSDGDYYEFYSMDLNELRDNDSIEANHPKLFLKSREIYLIDKNKNFVEQVEEKRLAAIGVRNYFDIEGRFAYFVWMGNLRVTRVDTESGAKVGEPFGRTTGNYVPLKPSTELVDAFYQMRGNRDARDKYFKEKRKFSTIRNLFTTSKYVIVTYEGPYKGGKSENFQAQFYLLDGQFVAEVSFRGQPDSIMHFDRDKKVLYSLSKSEKGDYSVLVHKILE